uniref:Uncharacterized protein n=1 Tax=Panagrolaimus superbus TaxID=310955 RepID=A0A914YK20_9BILA
MKMTPEFQSKVQSFLSTDNFQNCNHSSWLTIDELNPPHVQDIECFDKFEYGRVFFETFKSSTPNSSDECSVDRVEVVCLK